MYIISIDGSEEGVGATCARIVEACHNRKQLIVAIQHTSAEFAGALAAGLQQAMLDNCREGRGCWYPSRVHGSDGLCIVTVGRCIVNEQYSEQINNDWGRYTKSATDCSERLQRIDGYGSNELDQSGNWRWTPWVKVQQLVVQDRTKGVTLLNATERAWDRAWNNARTFYELARLAHVCAANKRPLVICGLSKHHGDLHRMPYRHRLDACSGQGHHDDQRCIYTFYDADDIGATASAASLVPQLPPSLSLPAVPCLTGPLTRDDTFPSTCVFSFNVWDPHTHELHVTRGRRQRAHSSKVDPNDQCYDGYLREWLRALVGFVLSETLRAADTADLVVWCLQEAGDHFVSALEAQALENLERGGRALPMRAYVQSYDDRDCAFLVFGDSRGVECVESLRLPVDGGAPVPPLQKLAIRRCGMRMCIVNVHLMVPRFRPGQADARRFTIVDDILGHLADSHATAATTGPDVPDVVVVAGDFNMKPRDLEPSYWEPSLKQRREHLIGAANIARHGIDLHSPNDHIFAVARNEAAARTISFTDATKTACAQFHAHSKDSKDRIMKEWAHVPVCLSSRNTQPKLKKRRSRLVGDHSDIPLSDHAPVCITLLRRALDDAPPHSKNSRHAAAAASSALR